MAQKPEVDSELDGYRRMAGEVYRILQRNRPEQKPHRYSDESRRLAQQLAEKIQLRLERDGRTLTRDPESGRYTIVDLPPAAPQVVKAQPTERRSLWNKLLGR